MPADLHIAVILRPQVIGMVDCPAGQPEHTPMQGLELVEITGRSTGFLPSSRNSHWRIKRLAKIGQNILHLFESDGKPDQSSEIPCAARSSGCKWSASCWLDAESGFRHRQG